MGAKGFTLIELLIVLTIVGILTAVAIPKFSEILAKSRFVGAVSVTREIHIAESLVEHEKGVYIFASTDAEILSELGVNTATARLFIFTITPVVGESSDFSINATVKTNVGKALSGDYFRINRNFEKWYSGDEVKKYAANFLEGATAE